MRGRTLLAAALAAAMAGAVLPSAAGPYRARAYHSVAALVGSVTLGDDVAPVELSNGNKALVLLVSEEPKELSGHFIWPEPNPQPEVLDPAQYTGCIFVYKGTDVDGGCSLESVQLVMDPTFSEATLTMTVESARPDGFYLTANIVLEGQGAPTPVEAHGFEVTPEPPAPPQLVFGQGRVAALRPAVARGSVFSWLLGRGSIESSGEPDSSMMQGLFRVAADPEKGTLTVLPGVVVEGNLTENVCLGTGPARNCPI